ncbi:MAG: cell division protein FtsW [Alphaproteobacteria bacterium]|nr:MAG: cell division protein FtsW [Alphaproteobacteria bacterium]
MSTFARTDTSIIGRWWWTVDRWTLAAIACLIFFGVILVFAASPAVATRIGLDSFYLARHHLMMLPIAVAIVLGVSLMGPRGVRRLAAIGFVVALLLTALTLVTGSEIKGATRWISILGFSLQPSEFLKPCFAVVAAWMFAAQHGDGEVPGTLISIALYALVATLLLLQPDLGMTFVVTATWFAQFFLAGLPILWVAALGLLGLAGLVLAYFTFSHVAERIDGFLDPSSGDSYQIDRSLEAFMNGGLYGRGPGEGTVKQFLPDAHADFIFAVAGEELGLFACLLIVGLFAFVVLRGLSRLLRENSQFVQLAATGLLVTFGLQALINMGSSLHLMPTKGMTLPFISYGGSSLLALSLGMGMLLALTRRRVGLGDLP